MSLCFLSMETSKVFNKRILESLEESGFEGLSEALIVLFPYIYDEQIITSAKLAKKVGYSRQAMHKNIKKLVDFEYIVLVSHNEKEKSIELTPKGLELINKANEYISNVEKDLSKLIGKKELDKYKILGTALELEQPPYLAIKIEAEISCKHGYQFEDVQQPVQNRLYEFIRPTVPIIPEVQDDVPNQNNLEPSAHHWEFGRNLYLSDLYVKIQAVKGVNQIIRLKMAYSNISPQEIAQKIALIKERTMEPIELEPKWKLESSMINTPPDGLLCLLECQVKESSA